MRGVIMLVLSLTLSGCSESPSPPPLLQNPGKRVGNAWFLCDIGSKQQPKEAMHNPPIVARLQRHFPIGSDSKRLERELMAQHFKLETCDYDHAIRIATFDWKGGFLGQGDYGGRGVVTYRIGSAGQLAWETGYVEYGGP